MEMADLVEQDGQYLQGPQDLEKSETLDLSPMALVHVIISSIVNNSSTPRQSTPSISPWSEINVDSMMTHQVVSMRKKKTTIHISVRR
jgi:hypothetical protein